ncbi:hypothetical protein H4Q26_004621 [Puccinia striiformis f. sp. tritici PST-130]|nr:hypothetical protein H4Q26_004621 [Puccinia striiformis f. sp. tritici PST-130]
MKSLHGKISAHALDIALEQFKKMMKLEEAKSEKTMGQSTQEINQEDGKCMESFTTSNGIPCAHKMEQILQTHGCIEPSDFHLQWHVNYNPEVNLEMEMHYNFDDDFEAFKQEILESEEPQALQGLMKKLRQIRSYTHVSIESDPYLHMTTPVKDPPTSENQEQLSSSSNQNPSPSQTLDDDESIIATDPMVGDQDYQEGSDNSQTEEEYNNEEFALDQQAHPNTDDSDSPSSEGSLEELKDVHLGLQIYECDKQLSLKESKLQGSERLGRGVVKSMKHHLPNWIHKHTTGVFNPQGDGNCGYRCIAHALAYGSPLAIMPIKKAGIKGVIPFPGPTLSKSLAQSPMADWMLAISSSTSLYESVVSSNVRETQKEGTLTVRTGTVDLMEQLRTTLGNHGMEFQMPTKPNLRISCQQPNLDLEELKLPNQEMDESNAISICCFCDEPLPDEPSPRFLKLSQYLQGVPEVEMRRNSSNPAALYLPFGRLATHCDLHRAETSSIPLGISKGWPLTINFESLPDRVTGHQKHLKQICTGEIDSTFLRQALEFWENLGPTKAQSVLHDFTSFHMTQPGYYGTQGFQVIIHTLNHIFPESLGILRHPLSNEFLLSRVFVPEVAKCLIAEDFGLDVTDPKVQEHLEESRRFGTIVFPDKDDLVEEKDESI